jgi:hypothetical protein
MTHQQNFQIVKELEYHSWRMKKKERNRVKKEKNTEKRKEYGYCSDTISAMQ